MRIWLRGIALAGGLWLGVTGAAGADRALVVGVDQYPQTRAPALQGCGNDARAMAEILRKKGFEVDLLLDQAATRAAILKSIQKGDKGTFLFYFAGYGSGPSQPRMLCGDTTQKGAVLSATLDLSELDKALVGAPAVRRLAILDTCFTGARSSDGPSDEVVRHYRAEVDRGVVLGSNTDLPGVTPGKVHYICSGRFNEESLEGACNGQVRGFFTSLLCEQLSKVEPMNWGGVQIAVSGKLASTLGDRQHPLFPASALAQAVFAEMPGLALNNSSSNPFGNESQQPVGGPPSLAGAVNPWSVFNVDVRDPKTLTVSVSPDHDTVKVGAPVQLTIHTEKPGYLVIMNHGSEGTLNLLYPRQGQNNLVRPGATIVIPDASEELHPDRSGRERVKAFLFSTESSYTGFLASVKNVDGLGFKNASQALGASRSLVFGAVVDASQAALYTADISFEVIK